MRHAPETPVVIFSTHSTRQNIAAAIEAGAKGFVTKPFQASTLLERVSACLPKAKK